MTHDVCLQVQQEKRSKELSRVYVFRLGSLPEINVGIYFMRELTLFILMLRQLMGKIHFMPWHVLSCKDKVLTPALVFQVFHAGKENRFNSQMKLFH